MPTRAQAVPTRTTTSSKRSMPFPKTIVQALDAAKILGIRSGAEHRYTGVWVVVVDERVYVRSWNDKPTGWHRAFSREPQGSIQVGDREIRIRVRHPRSDRVREAVSRAYAEKYHTKGSQKWVTGFAEPQRARTTLELLPARARV